MAETTNMMAVGGNLAADGESTEWTYQGGVGFISCAGTFGGGTATLQYRVNATLWVTTGTTFTVDAIARIDLPRGVQLRVSLAGATAPNLNTYMDA